MCAEDSAPDFRNRHLMDANDGENEARATVSNAAAWPPGETELLRRVQKKEFARHDVNRSGAAATRTSLMEAI